MVTTRRSPRQIVREEVIDGRVAELLERVDQLFDFDESHDQSRSSTQRRDTPDFTEYVRENLKAHFEDEIIPAIPSSQGDGYIDETELRHELAKKALVGLKLSALRDGAERLGASLAGSRNSEDIAEVIASALGWDSEAVARFVLENDDDASDTNAHGVRLYPLAQDSAHPDEIESEAVKLIGRYIRVALARWYVFKDIKKSDDGVTLYGRYMSYKADVDPMMDNAVLRSVSRTEDVDAHVAPVRQVVEVGNVTVHAARAAVFAATSTLKQRTLGYVPHAGSNAERRDGAVHGSAEFLLNVLQNRIPDSDVSSVNPTVARFKFDNDEKPADANAPALTSVRFDGNHILDSAQACRLIVEEGRPVAVIAFRMHLRYPASGVDPAAKRDGVFPVTISLESDHVRIVTGLGNDPVESWRAHEKVKAAVTAEMTEGHREGALDDILTRMRELASSTERISQPKILAPWHEKPSPE